MKTLKRTVSVLLAIILVSGSLVCFAADVKKEYHKYEKVLLLGDSEASGFTDYGDEFSEFAYVPDSYAAYVANDLGAELIPMACPGFRTVELRYMLDDNYKPQDTYLFTKVPHTSPEEIMAKVPQLRQAIAESDLITIGIGGNDWGAYLGWVMTDVELANPLPEEYVTALRNFLENASLEDDIIGEIINIANYLNAYDEVLAALPEAAAYAFSTLEENWKYIVEYIYENNPDVTLVAVGMFPTYLKTEEGAPDVVAEPDPISATVEDMMIAYGNKTMIDNQEKYGYIYVDTSGTVVEICHPTVAGHRHIADRILEALPDARFPYTDVAINSPAYKAIEYMYLNDILTGTDATTFSPDAEITKAEFSKALNKVTGDYAVSESTSGVTLFEAKATILSLNNNTSIIDLFSNIISLLKLIMSGDAFNKVTRAEAAIEIYKLV